MGTVLPSTVQSTYMHTVRSQMSCNQGLINSLCTVNVQDQFTYWTKLVSSPQQEKNACMHNVSLMETFIVAFMPTFWKLPGGEKPLEDGGGIVISNQVEVKGACAVE